MKKLDILHNIIGFIFIFNSMIVATARDYSVVEIDSVEYYGAKCGFEKYCHFLGKGYGCNSNSCNDGDNYFLYCIVNSDEEARDIYLEEIMGDGMWHDFSSINFDTSLIEFLQFGTPLERFMYAATIKHDTKISISDVKINSSPIAISKDGYIAGFKQSNNAYFVDFKIYKISLDKSENLNITELFSYTNSGTIDPWHVSHAAFSVFWKRDTLYIEGVRRARPNCEIPCYFKVVPQN